MSQTNLSNNDSMLHAENYTGLENKRIDRKFRYDQEKPQDDSQWHGTPVNSFLHISKRYADDQHEEYDRYEQISRFANLLKGNEGPAEETREST